jgi:hypothetical protein
VSLSLLLTKPVLHDNELETTRRPASASVVVRRSDKCSPRSPLRSHRRPRRLAPASASSTPMRSAPSAVLRSKVSVRRIQFRQKQSCLNPYINNGYIQFSRSAPSPSGLFLCFSLEIPSSNLSGGKLPNFLFLCSHTDRWALPVSHIRRPCWASAQIRSEQLVARARQILSVASGPAQFSVLF